MRSCLVVDDSRVLRTVARTILDELGFSVAEAATGVDALERHLAAPAELVLLDWDLPDMPGLKVLKTLCDGADGARPTVIVCSAEASATRMADAVREGAAEFLVKPFDEAVLRSRLQLAGVAT